MLPDIPLPFTLPILGDSVKGYGLMILIGFLSCVWLAARRTAKAKGDPDMILNMAFIALVAGFLGARVFYVVHYWNRDYAHLENRVAAILSLSGGVEFFGGFMSATVAILLYLWLKGASIRMYGDLVAPSVMWAHAFGRVGCLLAGCCWGQFCMTDGGDAALGWAVRFPYGSGAQRRHWEEMRTTLPGELIYVTEAGGARPIFRKILELTGEELDRPRTRAEAAQHAVAEAKQAGEPEDKLAKLQKTADREAARLKLWDEQIMPQLTDAERNFGVDQAQLYKMAMSESVDSLWLHPTQAYSAITLMIGSIGLSLLLRYRQRHGTVLAAMLIMYGVGRYVMEMMRSDNPHDAGGLTASQAISVGLLASGLITALIISQLPLRSPAAVPYVEDKAAGDSKTPEAEEATST